jgi:hypothetical protein
MTSEERRDALIFLVLAFVVLPLLPNRSFGPYGALNPHRITLAVVAFTAISSVGYFAIRAVGPRRGSAVAGFAGGFVSATATTATLARRSHEGEDSAAMVSAALLASVATFVQLIAVLAVVDRALARQMVPACAVGVVVLIVLGLAGLRRSRDREQPEQSGDAVLPHHAVNGNSGDGARSHPFSLRAALLFAILLAFASFLGEWAAASLGGGASVLVAGLTGLADAHAGALAVASMSLQGDISSSTAGLAVGAAVLGNMVVKVVVSVALGGRHFGLRFAAAVVPASAAFLVCTALSG